MLFARRWLAGRGRHAGSRSGRPRLRDWVEEYGLAGRERRVRVEAGSPLAGRTLEELRLRDKSGAQLLAIERDEPVRARDRPPGGDHALRSGDVLLDRPVRRRRQCRGSWRASSASSCCRSSGAYFADRSQEVGMVEVMLPEGSGVVGRTLVRSEFRTRYDVTVVGLRRGNEARSDDITSEELRVGDTLLVAGFWSDIRKLQTLPPRHDRPRSAGRAGRGAAGGQPRAAGAALPAAGRGPDGQRRRAQRAGGPDRLPADGRACAASTSPAPTARSTGRA